MSASPLADWHCLQRREAILPRVLAFSAFATRQAIA